MGYPENATARERLEWYADYDLKKFYMLADLVTRLEENFHYGDEAIHPED